MSKLLWSALAGLALTSCSIDDARRIECDVDGDCYSPLVCVHRVCVPLREDLADSGGRDGGVDADATFSDVGDVGDVGGETGLDVGSDADVGGDVDGGPQCGPPACELGTTSCQGPELLECVTGEDGCPELTTSSCEAGFVCAEGACVDIDECAAEPSPCSGGLAECANTDGGFTCGACPEGYDDVVGDGTVCEDLDECALGTHACDERASCTDTDGSYECACPEGFAGDGYACWEICTEGMWLPPGADTCEVMPGPCTAAAYAGAAEGEPIAEGLYFYDDGVLQRLELVDRAGNVGRVLSTYDEQGRQIQQTRDMGEGSLPVAITTYVYADDDALVDEEHSDRDADGTVDRITVYTYDEAGRVQKVAEDYEADGRSDKLDEYVYAADGLTAEVFATRTGESEPYHRRILTFSPTRRQIVYDASDPSYPGVNYYATVRSLDAAENILEERMYEGEDEDSAVLESTTVFGYDCWPTDR